MKNTLIIFLALSIVNVTYANDFLSTDEIACDVAAVEVEDARVQAVLKAYAEIAHFYQNQIDEDTLNFLAIKTEELEAQLSLSGDGHRQLSSPQFTSRTSE
jgi:hypothetical protein